MLSLIFGAETAIAFFLAVAIMGIGQAPAMAQSTHSVLEQIAKLDALRRQDIVLDEICRDYEYLSGLLTDGSDAPHFFDIRSSLAGLEAEIATYLNKDKP